MCAHMILIPQDELERIIADITNNLYAEQTDIAASYKDVYPRAKVPIVVPKADRLAVQVMQWGYSVSWQKDVVYNTKMETALGSKSNMWSDSIQNRRCLVPSYGFFEPHIRDTHPSPKTGKPIKDQYYFQMPDMDVVWMAGVFEDEHFSVMTTVPNQWMEKIHPRMPVVLRPDELDLWLHGDYPALADRGKMQLDSSKVAA